MDVTEKFICYNDTRGIITVMLNVGLYVHILTEPMIRVEAELCWGASHGRVCEHGIEEGVLVHAWRREHSIELDRELEEAVSQLGAQYMGKLYLYTNYEITLVLKFVLDMGTDFHI